MLLDFEKHENILIFAEEKLKKANKTTTKILKKPRGLRPEPLMTVSLRNFCCLFLVEKYAACRGGFYCMVEYNTAFVFDSFVLVFERCNS